MSKSKYPADLYYAVYDQLEYNKNPGCGDETETVIEIVEEHLVKTIQRKVAQAWQDGHDTALINGQSENPHDQEPR